MALELKPLERISIDFVRPNPPLNPAESAAIIKAINTLTLAKHNTQSKTTEIIIGLRSNSTITPDSGVKKRDVC